MSYHSDLLDPRWLKLRFFKLQAVGWKCESCGAKDKPFHVHHPRYKQGAKPWQYWITELEALCETCHSERHVKRETDVLLQVCYQAMAEAHRRCNWDEERKYAEQGMELIEQGFYYQGLV